MIYLDNAATTQMYPEVLEEMLPYFQEYYGNPSAIYALAGKSAKAVSVAREQIAALIHARKEEIYFTSGGSESDNWAIKAVAEEYGQKGKHIITTRIEHHAVLHACEYLEKQGFQVTYVEPDEYGWVSPDRIREAIRPDTILISVMAANNEIGTIQPLKEIGQLARERGILFHTDAVQAVGHIPLDVEELQIDLLSASAHKLHGPKGIGILYIRRNVKLGAFLHGGAQERHRRAGTLNVPAIVGFGKAAEIANKRLMKAVQVAERPELSEQTVAGEAVDCMREVSLLRDYLIDRVLQEIPYSRLNGSRENRLPGNASFCFRFMEGESLLILLDQQGICASGGSACTTGAVDPSHVLMAIGVPEEWAKGVIRLTLSEQTTREEIDMVVDVMKEKVEKLRSMSLEYEEFLKRQSRYCESGTTM